MADNWVPSLRGPTPGGGTGPNPPEHSSSTYSHTLLTRRRSSRTRPRGSSDVGPSPAFSWAWPSACSASSPLFHHTLSTSAHYSQQVLAATSGSEDTKSVLSVTSEPPHTHFLCPFPHINEPWKHVEMKTLRRKECWEEANEEASGWRSEQRAGRDAPSQQQGSSPDGDLYRETAGDALRQWEP